MTASRFISILLGLTVGLTFGCASGGHANQPAAASHSSQPAEMPKLRIRTAGPNAYRLIEDANGNPFFMAGWCPQNIIRWVPTSDFDAYFRARHNQGFNVAWVNVGCTPMWTLEENINARDYAGNHLRLDQKNFSFAPTNLNPAYVASVDAVVKSAQRNGVYLFLNVMSAMGGDTVWPKRTQAQCVSWGQFWGQRYANYPHVNFILGNDWMPQPQGNWIVSGIKQYVPDRLFMVDQGLFNHSGGHGNFNRPSPWYEYVDTGATWINLWGWYCYESIGTPVNAVNQYVTWLMYTQAERWGVHPAPTFLIESQYLVGSPREGNGVPPNFGDDDIHVIRRQLWSVVLGGGTGWGIMGNYIDACNDCRPVVNHPMFTTLAPYCKSFFVSRRWDLLVPDYGHTFLTSQPTDPTIHDPTYVSAALTTDGKFGAVYYPGVPGNTPTLTINLSRMAATSNVYWFDPTSNTTRSIPGSPFANSGSQTFTTPGKNAAGNTDWVLAIEAQ